ncbi:MAG: heavy metal translocating P-type ATPase [Rectinemataceae bacterium]
MKREFDSGEKGDSSRECSSCGCSTCENPAAQPDAPTEATETAGVERNGAKSRTLPSWLRKELYAFGASALLVALAFLAGDPAPEGGLFLRGESALTGANIVYLGFMATAYLVAGWNVLSGAFRNILRGNIFNELSLMSIATIGAFLIGEYEEALGVMVFYKIGEMLQEGAQVRSKASIRSLLDLRPESIRVRDGSLWREIEPAVARPGDEYMVLPGERLGLDGLIIEGETWLDTSAITGEPESRKASCGDEVYAGYIAVDGSVVIRATRAASESQVARIMTLVEDATRRKSRIEGIVSRFAAVYTPIVVGLAAAIAVIPPLFIPGESFDRWLYRALAMLVISCPCALVVSVPLGYFGGLGGAAKRGILMKGSSVMDALARAKNVVFDKTGTLTEGHFRVLSAHPAAGVTEERFLKVAAAAESRSRHPLAAAIRKAAGDVCAQDDGSSRATPTFVRELPGAGIVVTFGEAKSNGTNFGVAEIGKIVPISGGAKSNGTVPISGEAKSNGTDFGITDFGVAEISKIAVGNARLMASEGVVLPGEAQAAAADSGEVFVAENGVYLGALRVGDAVKPDAAAAVAALRQLGAARIVMLTGDAAGPATAAAAEAGVEEVHSGLLPEDKLRIMEAIIDDGLANTKNAGTTIFVGDGVNDAPVLARADVGIAMGSGADAAVESADVVLLTGEPSRVAEAVLRARRTHSIVTQNIVFALGFKIVFLGLGAAGLTGMWGAVIADVGVALLAVANSLRALR